MQVQTFVTAIFECQINFGCFIDLICLNIFFSAYANDVKYYVQKFISRAAFTI